MIIVVWIRNPNLAIVSQPVYWLIVQFYMSLGAFAAIPRFRIGVEFDFALCRESSFFLPSTSDPILWTGSLSRPEML